MPSCNPFSLKPFFCFHSQCPITGTSFLSRNISVRLSLAIRSESRNFHRVTFYSQKRLVIFPVLNLAQLGVLCYLERAESKEADAWYCQDYRLAQQIVTLSDEGKANPYVVAFLEAYGRKPEQITWWWRDRSALMRLALACGSNTPLLHANEAAEILSQIPDYDRSADQGRALPPKKPASPEALESGDSARRESAGRKKA